MSQQTHNKRWTESDDATLVKYVRVYPHNLHKAFVIVSEELADKGRPRTPSAVQAHWYSVLSKKPTSLCFFTASAKHVSKNRKNGVGVESNLNIWKRLLRIIKGL